MQKTVKRYLASRNPNGHTSAVNHGLVTIDNSGLVTNEVNDGIPIEDFGMYVLQDEPFPDDHKEIDKIFLAIIAHQEGDYPNPDVDEKTRKRVDKILKEFN